LAILRGVKRRGSAAVVTVILRKALLSPALGVYAIESEENC
jgi:hypothetical protein